MGKRTILGAENMSLGTGDILAAISSAADGAAASIVRVTRVEISQSGTATNAMIRAAFSKRDTAGTLTMTATTPQPGVVGGSASSLTGNTAPVGGTARTGTNSSADSGGTYTDQMSFNFANLNGYLFKPDYDEQIIIPASTVWVVRLLASPGTTSGWTIAIFLEELG
jgi:hypothetical protein